MSITSIATTVFSSYNLSYTVTREAAIAPSESDASVLEIEEAGEKSAHPFTESALAIEEDGDEHKSVLSNLFGGHFSGESELRLRMSFQEEISVILARRIADATTTGVTKITSKIAGEVEAFLKIDGYHDDTILRISISLKAFISVETTITTLSIAEETAANQDPISKLKSDFGSLIETLNSTLVIGKKTTGNEDFVELTSEVIEESVLAANGATESTIPVIEEGVLAATGAAETVPVIEESVLATSGTTETQPFIKTEPFVDEVPVAREATVIDARAFIARLLASFEYELELLISSLGEISVLPKFSEPFGKSGAYDKFLTMYSQLQEPAAVAIVATRIDIES